jgi:tetratricopeptide (TPR) repeat protein
MEYDKGMLKTWAEMETWDQHLERNGAFNKYVSKEGWHHIEQKYFNEVKRRIIFCKKLLSEHDDSCIYYTLAELYNRYNLDESPKYLYKRPVRYYCIKALRKNPEYAPIWFLLAESYGWVATLGGESKKAMPSLQALVEGDITVDIKQKDPQAQKRQTWFIERAIKCLKQAIKLDPDNRKYGSRSREYYHMKYEAIKMLSSSQNNGISP